MRSVELNRQRFALISFMLVLLYAFVKLMLPFFAPICLAAIFVVLFYPLYIKMDRWLGGRHYLSAFCATLTILVILILPGTLVTAVLGQQLYQVFHHFDFRELFSQFSVAPWYQDLMVHVTNFENKFHIKLNVIDLLTQTAKQLASGIYSYSPTVVVGTAQFAFGFLVMLVSIFFLFVEGKYLLQLIFDLSPLKENHEWRLAKRVRDTINASVLGYLVTGLVQGAIGAVLFYLAGLDAFVILATSVFFMSLVPLVGAAGVWVPVGIWLFMSGAYVPAGIVLGGGALLISTIDNVIKPVIMREGTNIHPLLIFFSLLGGIQLFGPMGILFGPVLTALLIASISIYREECL